MSRVMSNRSNLFQFSPLTDGFHSPPTTFEGYKKYIKVVEGFVIMDAHAWCEDSRGYKSDYFNGDPAYSTIRKVNGLTSERVYHKLEGEERKKFFKYLWKKSIKPRLKMIHDANLDIVEKAKVYNNIITNPGNCIIRAYILAICGQEEGDRDFPDVKKMCDIVASNSFDDFKDWPMLSRIEIGSMGWRHPDGRVWWEYG